MAFWIAARSSLLSASEPKESVSQSKSTDPFSWIDEQYEKQKEKDQQWQAKKLAVWKLFLSSFVEMKFFCVLGEAWEATDASCACLSTRSRALPTTKETETGKEHSPSSPCFCLVSSCFSCSFTSFSFTYVLLERLWFRWEKNNNCTAEENSFERRRRGKDSSRSLSLWCRRRWREEVEK